LLPTNRFFTFDYSLWDGGRHTCVRFCGQKQTLNLILSAVEWKKLPTNSTAINSLVLAEPQIEMKLKYCWKWR